MWPNSNKENPSTAKVMTKSYIHLCTRGFNCALSCVGTSSSHLHSSERLQQHLFMLSSSFPIHARLKTSWVCVCEYLKCVCNGNDRANRFENTFSFFNRNVKYYRYSEGFAHISCDALCWKRSVIYRAQLQFHANLGMLRNQGVK